LSVTSAFGRSRGSAGCPRYFSQGTGYTIDAIKKARVKRLVVLSALGVGDSRTLLNPVLRALMVDLLLKSPYVDHERQEEQVRASGLDWVIARPGRLTNGPARKRYAKKLGVERVPSSISRADVCCARPCKGGKEAPADAPFASLRTH
jgi:uncharacterized protein YbjT (DUF2867 family)